MKFEPIMRRGAALALGLIALAGVAVPVVAQNAKRAPKRIGQYTVPLSRFRGMGDTRFLPSGITQRQWVSDEAGKTRRQIGGANGSNVVEQVVNALPNPAIDQRTPFTTLDEKQLFFAAPVNAGGRFQLHKVATGQINNPAQPGTAVSTPITNEAGADHLLPVVDPNIAKILFVKSNDGLPVDATDKVWHLFVSDMPTGTNTISTTSPGVTNLVAVTQGRTFRGKAFVGAGRGCFIGANDIVFSGKLDGDDNYHLFSFNIVTRTFFQLTDGPADERNPAVSPEGKFIAFDSNATPTATGGTYTGGTTPRSQTAVGDPAIATSVNPSGRRNIFVSGRYADQVRQFTGRFANSVDADNIQPAFSSTRQNPFSNASGDNIYLAFASTRQRDTSGAVVDGSTYDVYMVPSSVDAGRSILAENSAQVAKLINTADPENVFNDNFPSWTPVIAMSRMAFQSDRTGNLAVNQYGEGFSATPGANDIFLASAIDISAPTLIRHNTNTSTGDIVHINLGDKYDPGQTVRTRDDGLLPGSKVYLALRVDDRESGIARVFLQFKNPNSYFQGIAQAGGDAGGIESKEYFFNPQLGPHVFFEGSPPQPLLWRDARTGRSPGIEYEAKAYVIGSNNQFADHSASGGTVPTPSVEDADAFSGAGQFAAGNLNGRPIPTTWLELKPIVDANGQPVPPADGRGGVLYGAEWTMPSLPTDWFIDAILFDNASNPFGSGTSNWIIYDNVWGCSTALPLNPGDRDILFVSDYTLGQKFFISRPGGLVGAPQNTLPVSFGAESYYTDSDMARYPTEGSAVAVPAPGSTENRVWSPVGPWFVSGSAVGYPTMNGRTDLSGVVVNPGTPNVLGVGSYGDGSLEYTAVPGSTGATRYALPVSGRYTIWRTLARGPVPAELLQSYLPGTTMQPADTVVGETGPKSRQVYNRLVVWAAPFAGNVFVGPGSITDLNTQNKLADFVNRGGRLLLSGQDIGFALAGNGQANGFFTNTLKARFTADTTNSIVANIASTGGTRFNTDGWTNAQHLFGETTDGQTYNYVSAAARPLPMNTIGIVPTGTGDAALTSDTSAGALLDVVAGLQGTTVEFNYGGVGAPGIISSTNSNGGAVFYASFGLESVGLDFYTWTPAGGGAVRIANRGARAKIMANFSVGYRTGQLAGRLIDDQGSPVSDALVRAVDGNPAAAAAGTAITDASGYFQIDGLVPGRYAIYGYKAGYYTQHSAGTLVNGTGRATASLVLKRANPGKLRHIDPDAQGPNPNAAGVFGIDKKTPITGIEIQARRRNPDGRITVSSALSQTSFPVGGYELKDLLIGDYEIIANAADTYDSNNQLIPNPRYNPDYGTIVVTSSPDPEKFALGAGTTIQNNNGRSVLVIEEDKVANIDFYLASAPQPLSGRVTDGSKGIGGAVVSATLQATGAIVASATTLPDGTYELETLGDNRVKRLPAGSYTISASKPGYNSNSVDAAITGPTPVVAPDIVLTAVPGGSISGYVTNVSEAGVAGATVKIYAIQAGLVDKDPLTSTVTTGNQNTGGYITNYAIADVPAGDYLVIVERVGLIGDPVQQQIVVNSAQETRNVNFRLLPPRVYGDGVQLVSVPFRYNNLSSIQIFGLTRTGDNDGDGDSGDFADTQIFDKFAVADWTGLTYNLGSAVPINPGKGYFIRFGGTTSVNTPGEALPGSTFTISLAPGWNLIGHPFADSRTPTLPGPDLDLFTQATVIDNANQEFAMVQAIQANLVAGVVFGYTGSNNGGQYFQTTIIKPWQGYWFKNTSGKTLKLQLTYPDQRSLPRRVMKTITRAALDAPVVRKIGAGSASDWRLQIGVRQGELLDMDNTVGVSSKGTDGLDPLLDHEKPPFFDSVAGVRMGIVGQEATGRKVLLSDNVRSSSSKLRGWDLEVTSNKDGDVEVVWPNVRLLPRSIEPVLVDSANGRRIAMRSASGYRFAHAGRAVHRLRVEIESVQSGPLAFAQVRMAGGRGVGQKIQFATTRNAEVAVEIQALSGRVLRRFDTRTQRGVEASVVWDGRDSSGSNVPAGTYMVNLTASDESGRVIKQKMPITSVR